MEESDYLHLIYAIENELPVDQWKIADTHIWPLIRIQLFSSLTELTGYSQNAKTTPALLTYARDLLKYLFCSTPSSSTIPDNENIDAIFLGDGISKEKFNDKWHDKLCDPLINEMTTIGKKSLFLELGRQILRPNNSHTIYIQHKLDLLRFLNSLLFLRNEMDTTLPRYDEFLSDLQKNNIPIHSFKLDALKKRVACMLSLSQFFQKLLKKINPTITFVVCYYNLEGFAFNHACKKLGIPSTDIQHGVQGEKHPAYGQWNKVPISGYELLPHFFWTWSEHEAKTIQKWSISVKSHHSPIIGGNLWLNKWLTCNDTESLALINRIRRQKESAPQDKHIVLSLQPGIENDGVSQLMLALITKTAKRWHWWLRLHPCMHPASKKNLNKLFLKLGISNVHISSPHDMPLYALISQMDLHITQSSSVVIEAAKFSIPSIILDKQITDLFPEETKNGLAKYLCVEKEILQELELISTSTKSSIVPGNSLYTKKAVDEHFADIFQLMASNAKPNQCRG